MYERPRSKSTTWDALHQNKDEAGDTLFRFLHMLVPRDYQVLKFRYAPQGHNLGFELPQGNSQVQTGN